MELTKTNFIQYLNCPKSLWLSLHKPDHYPKGEFSEYAKKLTREGYEVEAYVKQLLQTRGDRDRYSFQEVFKTPEGMLARADVVRNNEDSTINLYEVKSSKSVKDSDPHNHLKDAAFQTIAAEANGLTVSQIYIVHLDGEYVRNGEIDAAQLLKFSDETVRVRDLIDETRNEISLALELLGKDVIDENSCSCLLMGKAKHCDSFDYFNPDIPSPSIYNLPRIHKNKIAKFVNDGRFSLDDIEIDEVSPSQSLVLAAAHQDKPLIDKKAIGSFFDKIEYPVYFLDYETYSSAIPIVDGIGPQSQLPFQFSLHIKRSPDDPALEHYEFLEETPRLPLLFIERMEELIGAEGSVISWHKSFENTQNKVMAKQFPDKADFLNDVCERTLDLENIFKTGYVDIAFKGSTSIKNVLPVLASDLDYADMAVASGTDAMNAWIKLVQMTPSVEQDQLRADMLEYCKLDTYAMVRLYEEMERLISK